MKRVSPEVEGYIEAIREKMAERGLRRIRPAILEKDAIVTEVIHAVATLSLPAGMAPVFCGGTCLSKAYDLLERMSEDADFKMVRDASLAPLSKTQQRKQLSELKGAVLTQLEAIGFPPDDLELSARDENRYIVVNAYFSSRYAHEPVLRDHVQLELNTTSMQRPPAVRSVARIIDPWLQPAAQLAPRNLYCVTLLEAMAEKLIAFPRRLAHALRDQQQGGQRPLDSTLVRHLYDVARLTRAHPNLVQDPRCLAFLRDMMQTLVLKDGQEFQHQHPQFVADPLGELRWAMTQARTFSIAAQYQAFLDAMVYAPPERLPSFQEAMGNFDGALEAALAPQARAAMGDGWRDDDVSTPERPRCP